MPLSANHFIDLHSSAVSSIFTKACLLLLPSHIFPPMQQVTKPPSSICCCSSRSVTFQNRLWPHHSQSLPSAALWTVSAGSIHFPLHQHPAHYCHYGYSNSVTHSAYVPLCLQAAQSQQRAQTRRSTRDTANKSLSLPSRTEPPHHGRARLVRACDKLKKK